METSTEVRNALIELEAALQIRTPVGAAELPDEIRFFRVLNILRTKICPRLEQFAEIADSSSGDLVAAIADTIISAVGKFPVPATTLAKQIVVVGAEKFCTDPATLLAVENIDMQEGKRKSEVDGKSTERN